MKKFPAILCSTLLCIAIVGLLVFIATPSFALVIYNAGEPSTLDNSVWLSDVDESVTGSGARQQIGGYFILEPGENVINDIHWWGIYPNPGGPIAPGDDDFTIRLFLWNDVGEFVEVPYFYQNNIGNDVQRTDLGLDVDINLFENPSNGTYDIYEYYAEVDPIPLAPDTRYLLSAFNNTVELSYNWSWSRSFDDNGFDICGVRFSMTGSPDGLPWGWTFDDVAFKLTYEPVPEPAFMLLLGSGLIGLAGFRRKFRRK